MRRLFAFAAVLFSLILVIVFVTRTRGDLLRGLGSRSTSLPVDLAAIKPSAWSELAKPANISIDGDEDKEWLLLYRDQSGLTGGAVIDKQNEPLGNQSVAVPESASAFLTLYRLLPGSTASRPAGYLSEGKAQPQHFTLSGDSEGLTVREGNNLLLVVGAHHLGETSINRVSLFWWVSREQGYSATQATTPGWFSLSAAKPDDAAWQELVAGARLWAWEPQMDRSGLCRRALWEIKKGSKAEAAYRFVAHYNASTLVFCTGITPAEPFYPEGQVLAFALDGNEARLATDAAVATAAAAALRSSQVLELLTPDRALPLGGEGAAPCEGAAPGESGRIKALDAAMQAERTFAWSAIQLPPTAMTEPIRWRINCLAEVSP